MTWKKYAATLLALLCVCLLASNALAQRSGISEADRATARNLYNLAVDAYDKGQYNEALTHWLEAYELTGTTILLYSIGNAHERLGNLEEAIEALSGYKTSVRDRTEIELLEMRLHNLEERHAAQQEAERLRQEALERERADAEARELHLRSEQERLADELRQERIDALTKDPKGLVAVRWTTIGLAGAAAITGGVFQILASTGAETLRGECEVAGGAYYCPEGSASRFDRRERDLNAAKISYIVAGGLGLVGISLLFVHPNKDRTLDELALEPIFYGDGGGMRFRARF